MDELFSRSLAEWTAYYALMGGAAATLLGLLFVAVSVRLNIFHQRNVADVRDFAAFTLGSFLVAIGVAGLALAPHARRISMALPLLIVGVIGLIAIVAIVRLWRRLNHSVNRGQPDLTSRTGKWWAALLGMAALSVGLIVAAALLIAEHPAALGWLAIVEAAFLILGTAATWLMLSHAGGSTPADTDGA